MSEIYYWSAVETAANMRLILKRLKHPVSYQLRLLTIPRLKTRFRRLTRLPRIWVGDSTSALALNSGAG